MIQGGLGALIVKLFSEEQFSSLIMSGNSSHMEPSTLQLHHSEKFLNNSAIPKQKNKKKTDGKKKGWRTGKRQGPFHVGQEASEHVSCLMLNSYALDVQQERN